MKSLFLLVYLYEFDHSEKIVNSINKVNDIISESYYCIEYTHTIYPNEQAALNKVNSYGDISVYAILQYDLTEDQLVTFVCQRWLKLKPKYDIYYLRNGKYVKFDLKAFL